ncbi:MAG: hypothetical protein ACPGRT_02180 [Flavobacteriaceae bacterium]
MADMEKSNDLKKKDDMDERIRLARKGIVKVDPTEGGTAKYTADEEAAKSFLQTEEAQQRVQQKMQPEARRALSDRLASSLLIKDPMQRQEAVSGLQKEGEKLGILKSQFDKVAGDYASAMEKQIGTPQREERTRSFLEEMRNKSLGQRRRKTFSRFDDLKLARRYQRLGFDKPAQAVAMRGALGQQEAPLPSVASRQFLGAREDVLREKTEMQNLQKKLMERLLGKMGDPPQQDPAQPALFALPMRGTTIYK